MNSEPHLVSGTTRLFAERSTSLRLEMQNDEYGFLKRSHRFFEFHRLLDRGCTLVVAPPWVGKSFTARRIDAYLKACGPEQAAQRSFFTDPEARLTGQPIEPEGWGSWRDGDEPGVWIIDGVDEGQRRERGFCQALLQLLANLSPEQKGRLSLLLFARETDLREVAKSFEAGLERLFGDAFSVAQLLPLDADNARDLIESTGIDEKAYERVLHLIKRNSLQSVAPYPAALEYLAPRPADAELAVRDVWKGVLEQLLVEHNDQRQQPFQSELEHRFAAAARIAAALTLAGHDELATSATDHLPTLGEVIAASLPPREVATRSAAREALRSPMFRATADGHRFVHKNVREWMAAFELSKLDLAQLRPLLKDEATASIRPEFMDLSRLLTKTHDLPLVREWIATTLGPVPSDIFIQDITAVRVLLDRLEQLAGRGASLYWLDDPDEVAHLAVAGLGEEIAGRVLDVAKPPAAQVALLRIGALLDLDDVLTAVAPLIRDTKQDEQVRLTCAGAVARSGRADLLIGLDAFLKSADPATRAEKELVALLLSANLRIGAWSPAEVFRYMPRGPASKVVDHFRVLPRIVEEHMSDADAFEIVSSVPGREIEAANSATEEIYKRGPDFEPPPWWKTYCVAAIRLASTPGGNSAHLQALFPFALSLGIYTSSREGKLVSALRKGFSESVAARRELLQSAISRQREEQGTRPAWWVIQALQPEDLDWLEPRLAEFAEAVPQIWQRTLHLAAEASDEATRHRIREVVHDRAPELFADYQRYLEEQEKEEQSERRRKEQDEARRCRIEDVDRDLLTNRGLERKQLLSQLSWVNFSDDQFRPRNLIGSWSDVQPDLQEEILVACAAALDYVEPTPIPQGASFPAMLQYEAQAFAALLEHLPGRFELTAERINRWLPAVLKTLQSERIDLLEKCFRVNPDLTERLLLEAIAGEISSDNAYSILLQDLPSALWTEGITRWVSRGIGGALPAPARPRLLDLLSACRPEEGVRIARELLTDRPLDEIVLRETEASEPVRFDELGVRALDVLIALAPDEAWLWLERGVSLAGDRLLHQLHCLSDHARQGLRARWREWPLDRIARLAELLFQAFPPEKGPPRESGWASPVDEIQELRWRLLEHLAQATGPQADGAVRTAKRIHQKAAEFIDWIQSSREAGALLAPPRREQQITIGEACRLLDEKYFRLIRSAHDLLEVVVEELDNLEQDLENDHAMLFCPSVDELAEKRRREEALQAYVRRRLEDRLPDKVLDRETQVKLERKTDIRVLAPVVGTKALVKVVIEVKWSDNGDHERGVSTSLTEKLGKHYLLNEGLAHGVYLVGWNGKLGTWRDSAVPKPTGGAEGLRNALLIQAERFRQQHPGIDIRPVVWHLEPKAGRASSTAQAARGRRRGGRRLTRSG
jgi:hypothetical protein